MRDDDGSFVLPRLMLRFHLPPRRRSYLREGATRTARVATEPNASPSLPTLRPASPSRPSPSRLRPRPEPPRGRTTSTAPTRPSRVAPASTPSARDKSPENSATSAKTTSEPEPDPHTRDSEWTPTVPSIPSFVPSVCFHVGATGVGDSSRPVASSVHRSHAASGSTAANPLAAASAAVLVLSSPPS